MTFFNASKLMLGMFAFSLIYSSSTLPIRASEPVATLESAPTRVMTSDIRRVPETTDLAQDELSESIKKVLKAQDDAWNRGDLDEFMQTYSKSANTSYVSADAQVWGYDAILARYQKRYGHDKESMGNLTFANLKTFAASLDSAVCVGNWHSVRKSGEQLDGVFSLVFVKQKDGWKILHDHTSLTERKKP